jgi:phosphonoacetate hydrolase
MVASYDLVPAEGGVAAISARGMACVARAAGHELDRLSGQRLRSHGGLSERAAPLLFSRPLDPACQAAHAAPRNSDAFAVTLNRTHPS